MHLDRPPPGEEINPGPPSEPRQAATVMLLRSGPKHASGGLEVLLVKRHPEQRFMPGAWVFPGGAVDAAEGSDDAAHRAAGVRELREEAGISLPGPDELVPFSRWITPAVVKTRFDTRFYVALAPPHSKPQPDGDETVDAVWIAPRAALERHAEEDFLLVFPTIKHLEALRRFGSADEVVEAARRRPVEPVEPRVIEDGEGARVLLPGEPGYD